MANAAIWIIAATASAAAAAGGLVLWGPTLQSGSSHPLPVTRSQAQEPDRGTIIEVAHRTVKPVDDAKKIADAPRRTETITYNSWVVTCSDTIVKGSKKVCRGVLEVLGKDRRRVVLVWIIERDKKGALRATIRTPTGVQIEKGVALKLGSSPVEAIPYTACTSQLCEASTVIDVAAMKKKAASGSDAVATIYAVSGQEINFKFSFKGIDDVLAATRR